MGEIKKISINDAIFDFVYSQAMGDATRRTDCAGLKNELLGENGTTIKSIVKKYIEQIFDKVCTDQTFYDTVTKIEEHIRKEENELSENVKNNFTFGNIQKLINMTAKYFYIACYQNIELRGRFDNCHCPMDSIMIKKVREKYKGQIDKTRQLKSDTAWSRLKMDEKNNIPKAYEEFQNLIKELCKKSEIYKNPLEFDFFEWNNK